MEKKFYLNSDGKKFYLLKQDGARATRVFGTKEMADAYIKEHNLTIVQENSDTSDYQTDGCPCGGQCGCDREINIELSFDKEFELELYNSEFPPAALESAKPKDNRPWWKKLLGIS
jgi:hypothetical protein